MATIVYGDLEWGDATAGHEPDQARDLVRGGRHRVVDPNAVFLADDSGREQRLVAIGMSKQIRVLFVVHVERGQRDRIISARVATRAEETFYEQGS